MSRSAGTSLSDVIEPKGYKGLYAFHKYWGKKPAECMAFLIESLSEPGDLVVDPFLGFGAVAREALLRGRFFGGSDINPISIELGNLLIDLPEHKAFRESLERIEKSVKPMIQSTYNMECGGYATHYLWDEDNMILVIRMGRGIRRQEFRVSDFDTRQSKKYANYKSRHIRNPIFFDNSRINAKVDLNLHDFFTGRALFNIDLLIDSILEEPEHLRRPLMLTLTAAVGQMSKMVFAVSERGKKGGRGRNTGVQVGSWAIGFWRPEIHFEISVWNCFYNKGSALLKSLEREKNRKTFPLANDYASLAQNAEPTALLVQDCAVNFIESLEDSSIKLLVTDPPHSDRMPYLELSELWNSILGVIPDFDKEIVVSNAMQREKDQTSYGDSLNTFFTKVVPKLRDDGFVAVMFNARRNVCWEGLHPSGDNDDSHLHYIGRFPMVYSAGSLAQDNRSGSLKHDFVLIYVKTETTTIPEFFKEIPGWSTEFPV